MTCHYPDLGSAFQLAEANYPRGTTNQKYYPEVLASDIHVTSMEFLRSFLRRHFAGNGVVKFRLLSQAI